MRIVSYLFSIIFATFLVAVVAFFVGREALLWWSVYTFTASIKTLQLASQGTYDAQCQQRLGASAMGATLQLRFLSSKKYVIEAACDQFATAPILIQKGQLGPFVTKRPGSSGIILSADTHFVELLAFGQEAIAAQKYLPVPSSMIERSTLVGLENMRVVNKSPKPGERTQSGPITSCEGYGYFCCVESSEKGAGEQITGLQECKNSCFSQCVKRPVILSLTTNPVLDLRTRQVMISSGGGIEFSYVSDGDTADNIQAIMDFGDGTQPGAINGKDGSLTHLYTCANRPCTYNAKLKLIDKWNIESFASPVSTVTVVVQ